MVPITTPLPSIAGIRISSVSAGTGFNAAASAAGRVYTWGIGTDGRLGCGDTEGSLVPKQVQALAGHRVLSVSAEHDHCLALTENSAVFSWEWDVYSPCGHGSPSNHKPLPRRVDALMGVRARSASAGDMHSLVVIEEGALYSFGCGSRGNLGRGSNVAEHTPKMVVALRHVRIAAAAAGAGHSLALAEDGSVFSWCRNGFDQLGLGRSGGDETLPLRVEALIGLKVCSVAAGFHASCAVTAAGEIGWTARSWRHCGSACAKAR